MKAESFAHQFIRTTVKDKIDFWLFPVEAEDYHLFTAEKWESELFRQIKLFIDDEIKAGRIDEETIQPGSQPNLSPDMEYKMVPKIRVMMPMVTSISLFKFLHGVVFTIRIICVLPMLLYRRLLLRSYPLRPLKQGSQNLTSNKYEAQIYEQLDENCWLLCSRN
jgi:hypothetical protein